MVDDQESEGPTSIELERIKLEERYHEQVRQKKAELEDNHRRFMERVRQGKGSLPVGYEEELKGRSVLGMDTYQRQCAETAIYRNTCPDQLARINYCVLGLVGEAGELANKLKKVHRGDTILDFQQMQKLVDELGDVLWYSAMLADELGVGFGYVGEKNINKLRERRERNTLHGSGDKR